MTQTTFIQIPLEVINYVRSLRLSGTQYDLWLYLYSHDPYGDRFCEIPSPAQIAAELNVDPRTIQRAAQRLQDADLFDFQIDSWKAKNTTSNTKAKNFGSDKKIPNATKRSKCRQNDPDGDKTIQMSPIGQNDPNVELEALRSEFSRPSQTIQTIQTSQTATQTLTGEDENLIEETSGSDCLKLTTSPLQEGKLNKTISPSKITTDLINKLEELEIPLDTAVKKAINQYDLSQVWGAIRHIEDTWETVKNPRSVFLYQLPKQTVDKSKPKPLCHEFLEWYQYARGEIVPDIPPEHLPRDQYGEPRVYLKNDPSRLIGWRRVKNNEVEPDATPEQIASAFDQIRQILAARKGT